MKKLFDILKEKETEHSTLRKVLEEGKGTEEENAKFLYIGGYIQALRDVLGIKNA